MSRPLPYLFLLPLITSVLLVFTGTAVAKDWPTWRYDAGRTNISSEKIPEPLHLQWKRQLPPVTPAFRKSRLQFDEGYEPIVVGDTLSLINSKPAPKMASLKTPVNLS